MSVKTKPGSVRTSISLTKVVDDMAAAMMRKKGFDNFSAYVADLIRRDQERTPEESHAPPAYPPHRPADLRLNEPTPRK